MFKGYSSKSSALKGAARAGVAVSEVYLGDCEGTMKWGYMVAQAQSETPASDTKPASDAPASDTKQADPELVADLEKEVRDLMKEQGLDDEDGEGDGEVGIFPQASASMFSGMASTLQNTTPAAPAIASSGSNRGAYKIEKDRPMQNGVKRPSEGGLCRAVWDWCWEQQAADATAPTSKTVKAQADVVGWNTNNAMIEFYNWRKYNGISGRTNVVTPTIAEPQTEEERASMIAAQEGAQ